LENLNLTNYILLERITRKQGYLKQKYDLNRVNIAVLLSIALYFNFKKYYIYPSQTQLAEIIGDNKSNISKHLAILEEKGLIKSFKEKNRKKYQITINTFKDLGLFEAYTVWQAKIAFPAQSG